MLTVTQAEKAAFAIIKFSSSVSKPTLPDVDDNMAPILVERGFFLVKISVKPNNHFRLNLDLKTSLSPAAAQFPILDA